LANRTQLIEIFDELQKIGFSLYEAKAYVALLPSQPANGYDLAKLSGIPSSKIYETLQRLVDKGAALASAHQPTLYRAAPPGELLAGVRRRTEDSLAFLEGVLPGLSAAPATGIIWRLGDRRAILDHLQGLVAQAEGELYLSLWPAEAADLVEPVGMARRRGVRLWVASFGPGPLVGEGVQDLFSCGASSAARLGRRLMAAVADDRRVLIAEFRDDAEPSGTMADDPSLALVAKEYIIHDLVNHALIEELGPRRFAAMRREHPLVAGILGPEPAVED
jgi:sugar-specific transcriptional regulator TrmB